MDVSQRRRQRYEYRSRVDRRAFRTRRTSRSLSSVSGQALVVTHVGVMRVLLARATGWDFDGEAPFRVKRDRLYRIDVHGDGTLAHDHDPVRLIQAGIP